MKLLLLKDYRSQFYSSTRFQGASVDVGALSKEFRKYDIELDDRHFAEINFRSEDFKDCHVLYQSSEDPDLHYKDYIEDILLGLQKAGAILIPDFELFRAHHNKVFMEVLRDLSKEKDLKNLVSQGFGTFEEYSAQKKKGPAVIKPGAGSRSASVKLMNSPREQRAYPKRVARSMTFSNFRRRIRSFASRKSYLPISNHRKKFVVQEYVSGLKGDYKVLVYGDKHYVLRRDNRTNDFRASGSGKLSYPETLPVGLLDYAQRIFKAFNSPYASLDIAEKDGEFYVLEFQFLSFGQYTLEYSDHYYRKQSKQWEKVIEKPNLEREIARSVSVFLKNSKSA
jgi:glutathione synthase/RimK-type ligase-like ATP-grasp enzyme